MQDLVKREDYLILKADEDVGALIRENLGEGEDISSFDLERIKMPSGGGTAWNIPTLEGNQPANEVRGVIVGHFSKRLFWSLPFEETGGVPPECFSEDAIHGHGAGAQLEGVNGLCSACPFSKWETAAKGKGQACKQVKLVFFVREGSRLPMVISFPPTSLRAFKKYALGLANQGIAFWKIETVFSLEETKNDRGVKYSKVTLKPGRLLSPEAAEAMRGYKEAIQSSIRRTPVQSEDYAPAAAV